MKRLIAGFIFVFFLHFESVAQVNIENIPLKVNVIELTTGLSYEENFTLVGKKLVALGFLLEQVQKDFGYITADAKNLSKMDLTFKLKVIVEENRIKISGNYNMPRLDNNYDVIFNKGMKGSPMKVSFEEMLNIALKIPHSEVNFFVINE